MVVIEKFHSEEEVIKLANDSIYGLGGGLFTRDLNRAIRVARAIETGRMWINTYNAFPAGRHLLEGINSQELDVKHIKL